MTPYCIISLHSSIHELKFSPWCRNINADTYVPIIYQNYREIDGCIGHIWGYFHIQNFLQFNKQKGAFFRFQFFNKGSSIESFLLQRCEYSPPPSIICLSSSNCLLPSKNRSALQRRTLEIYWCLLHFSEHSLIGSVNNRGMPWTKLVLFLCLIYLHST